MGCCSATAPATPIVSPPKGFRLRCSFSSSTNGCAARSPIAASTTAPTPSTSRPANSKPPTTAPTQPFNRSSISWPLDLSAAIVELFLSTILPRRIYVSCGASPQGQGMKTIFSQVVADIWRVAPEDVVLTFADTAAIAIGFGTMASRSTVTASAAIHHASARLRQKVFAIVANLLECAPADLELRDGGVGVVGVPGAAVSLAKVAQAARPGWENPRPEGIEAGLEETYYWQPPTVTWSYAVHAAIVDVDRETGRVGIENYAVAHDCGVVVNPMLVEGQIMGGAAQGLGGILLEGIAYDANGQLLSGSLMDYALPTASDIPAMRILHQHSPSPLNPLGVKGVGEGGAVAPPAAIANAVCDALAPFGIEINATPIRPEEIVRFLRPR